MISSHSNNQPEGVWPPPPSITDLDSEEAFEGEVSEDHFGVLNRFFVLDIVFGSFAGGVLFISAMLVIILLVHILHFSAVTPSVRHVFYVGSLGFYATFPVCALLATLS